MIFVEGLPFLNGDRREIAKERLTRKCLCQTHNSQLAPYDNAAISFAKALEYARELSAKRKGTTGKLSVHRKVVDYDKFCRWVVKTYLGFLDFFPYPSSIEEGRLAKLAFSQNSIRDFVQLTFSMSHREQFKIQEDVAVWPMYVGEKTMGMRFEIYGTRVDAVFSELPQYKQPPIKIRFVEPPNRLSCIVEIK
jgi:hypothetical protein